MKSEKLALAGAVSLVGSAFAALSALLVTTLVGRSLGASGTGVFYQAIAVFTIVTALLKLGTNSGIVRSVAGQRALNRSGGETRVLLMALGPVCVVGALVGLGMVVIAPSLAGWLEPQNAAEMRRMIIVLAPYVLVAAVLSVLHTSARMMRGVLSFTVLQNIALPLSRLAGVAMAIAVGWQQFGVVNAWLAPLPLWVLVTLLWLARPIAADRRLRRGSPPVEEESFGQFWRFTGPRAFGAAIEYGLDWTDVLIVGALRSPAEAGVYAVATRAVMAGQLVDRAMRIAVSPAISAFLVRGENQAASLLHTKVTRAMLLCSWPFYLTLVVMGPAIMGVFGPGFRSGWVVLATLGGVMMVAVACGMLQSILLMGGHSTWQVYNKGAALALSIVCNLLLVPRLGILGAALTWAIVVLVDNGIAVWLVHFRMRVHLAPLSLMQAAVPPLLVFGAGGVVLRLVFGESPLDLVAYLVLLAAVYLPVLWWFRERLGIEMLWRALALRRGMVGARAVDHQP